MRIVWADEPAAGGGRRDQAAPPVPMVPMAAGVTTRTTGLGAWVSRVGRRPDRPSWGILCLPFVATRPPRRRIGLIDASATLPIGSGSDRHRAAWVYVTEP